MPFVRICKYVDILYAIFEYKLNTMKILIFIAILFFSIALKAQTIISGSINNNKSKPIANVNVQIENSYDGTSTDLNGNFSFSTSEKGKQKLILQLDGYKSDTLLANCNGATLNYSITLRQKVNTLDAVEISVGSFEASDSKKAVVLRSLDIATTAGSQADIFAALQTLPGVQAGGNENGLFVRGGDAAETKTFFDGMMVKNPFGAQLPDQVARGRFSPFMFKGTTFSAGGYSSQYGQALSSALILDSKDLIDSSVTDLSIMSVGLGVSRTQRFEKSSLTAGINYYNLSPIFSIIPQNANWDKNPQSLDASVFYKWRTSGTGMLKIYSDYTQSDVSLFTENLNELDKPMRFTNQNKNNYNNITYQAFISDEWKLNAGLSYNLTTDNGITDTNTYFRNDDLLQGKVVLTNFFGKNSLFKTGIDYFRSGRKEGFINLSRKYSDHITAVYFEADLFFTDNLVARIGSRLEYTYYLNEVGVAPRTSLTYRTGKNSQVSAAYGRFYQNPSEEYLVQTNTLTQENADHSILNYQLINSSQTFRVELYYKQYSDLTTISNKNILANDGSGYARGIDIFWRDKKTFKGVDYWVSYSFLDTRRKFRDFPSSSVPQFAAKHTTSLVYKKYFSLLKSYITGTYTFATGRTYINPNNSTYLGDVAPNYHNLSLSCSYLTTIFGQSTVIFSSISNIPGFNQIFGYNYSADGSKRAEINPPAKRQVFLGVFISIGGSTFSKQQ